MFIKICACGGTIKPLTKMFTGRSECLQTRRVRHKDWCVVRGVAAGHVARALCTDYGVLSKSSLRRSLAHRMPYNAVTLSLAQPCLSPAAAASDGQQYRTSLICKRQTLCNAIKSFYCFAWITILLLTR